MDNHLDHFTLLVRDGHHVASLARSLIYLSIDLLRVEERLGDIVDVIDRHSSALGNPPPPQHIKMRNSLVLWSDGRFLLLLALVDGCPTGDVGLEAGVEVVAADLEGDEALAILTPR